MVGNEMIRGISGGQRKRVTTGIVRNTIKALNFISKSKSFAEKIINGT
jgi:hypothetical protein